MKTLLQPLAYCAVLILACSTAWSETNGHRQAAEKLLELTNSDEVFMGAFMSAFEPFLDNLQQAGVSDEKIAEVRKAAREFATQVADDPELNNRMIDLYIESFSEAEMKDLIAFYETPAGEKFLTKMPELMQKGAVIGQEVAEKHQDDFSVKLQEILGD